MMGMGKEGKENHETEEMGSKEKEKKGETEMILEEYRIIRDSDDFKTCD